MLQEAKTDFYLELYQKHCKEYKQKAYDEIIKGLKKTSIHSKYSYNLLERVIDTLEKHLIKIVSIIISVSIILEWALSFCQVNFESYKFKGISDVQLFAGMIQVTVVALIVPIAIILLQSIFKNSSYYNPWVKIILIETNITFLVKSNILLLAIVFTLEFIRSLIDFNSVIFIFVTTIWFLINSYIAYKFVISSINLATPSGQILALKRFIVNTLYQKDLLENSSSCYETLIYLREAIIKSINELDIEQFRFLYINYLNFHLLLLELMETKVNKKNRNLATIPIENGNTRSFSSDWARSYYEIFELAIIVFPKESQFFVICCYVSHSSINNTLAIPSIPNSIDVISMHGYLLRRFNEKWIAELKENKVEYVAAIDSFIQQWQLLHTMILEKNSNIKSWEDANLLFVVYKAHIDEILFFIRNALFNEDNKTAIKLAAILSNWINKLEVPENYNKVTYIINASFLNKEWEGEDGVKVWLIKQGIDLPRIDYTLQVILVNYWQDISLLLAIFIIRWRKKKKYLLSHEIFDEILQKILPSKCAVFSKISAFEKFFFIFLRMGLFNKNNLMHYIEPFRELHRKLVHSSVSYINMEYRATNEWPLLAYLNDEPIQFELNRSFVITVALVSNNQIISDEFSKVISTLLANNVIAPYYLKELIKILLSSSKDLISQENITKELVEEFENVFNEQKLADAFKAACQLFEIMDKTISSEIKIYQDIKQSDVV